MAPATGLTRKDYKMVMDNEDGSLEVTVYIPFAKLKANNKYPGTLEVAIASYIETQAETLAKEVIAEMRDEPFDNKYFASSLREKLSMVRGYYSLKRLALWCRDDDFLLEVAEALQWHWDVDAFEQTGNGWKGPNNE